MLGGDLPVFLCIPALIWRDVVGLEYGALSGQSHLGARRRRCFGSNPLYLALQWGSEGEVEIMSSRSVLSSLKAWSDPVSYSTDITGYQLRFSRVFLGY